MPICLLITVPDLKRDPRFYRIEIQLNLFGEWSVVLEWGLRGGAGQQRIALFNDLRAASYAADTVRERMLRKGYLRA
ncbi:MAG: WGR domain-containing protein [Pseudoruegeria sp.]